MHQVCFEIYEQNVHKEKVKLSKALWPLCCTMQSSLVLPKKRLAVLPFKHHFSQHLQNVFLYRTEDTTRRMISYLLEYKQPTSRAQQTVEETNHRHQSVNPDGDISGIAYTYGVPMRQRSDSAACLLVPCRGSVLSAFINGKSTNLGWWKFRDMVFFFGG